MKKYFEQRRPVQGKPDLCKANKEGQFKANLTCVKWTKKGSSRFIIG